jgi:2'-5' RNA ligase
MAGGPRGLPLHISILYPFLADDSVDEAAISSLKTLIASTPGFRLSFERLRWFDKNVVWLEPCPSMPLRQLTESVVEMFPSCEPYGGQFDEIIPHLTVAERKPLPQMRLAELIIRRRLPVVASAGEVWLMAEDSSGRWCKMASFALGPCSVSGPHGDVES